MARVRLNGGYYKSQSLIASAQRCVNLYPEGIPQAEGEPSQTIDYLTPGLRILANPGIPGPARGLFLATSGALYYVVGATVYLVWGDWSLRSIGTIGDLTTPVSATDNGSEMLIVDGSSQGWQIDLATHVLSEITDEAFAGATRVDSVDGYILGNIPRTRTFFSSDNNALTFDPLFVANKSGYADTLVSLAITRREICLIGDVTAEIWFDAGGADFPFQIMSGPFIQHGCRAPYSVAKQGSDIFWLSQDLYGTNILLRMRSYEGQRVSTSAVEAAWGTYSTTADAVAWCYQLNGHQFYVISFPSADATWVFDDTTGLWHEWVWIDDNGTEHRHRASCGAYAYNTLVVGDWQYGTLYALDPAVYTDAGQPIIRRRTFPHMIDDMDRVSYSQFVADMEVGSSVDTTAGDPVYRLLESPADGWGLGGLLTAPTLTDTSPQVSLRWSDDRGVTWGNPLSQTMGATGQYLTSIQWQRLGMGRDRIFEISFSADVKTSLQGAFVTSRKLGT